jgi:hypothetical protein
VEIIHRNGSPNIINNLYLLPSPSGLKYLKGSRERKFSELLRANLLLSFCVFLARYIKRTRNGKVVSVLPLTCHL